MGSTIFTPGPSRNTVRIADGRGLTIPEGWVLLSPGDAVLTRGVKAAGEHWVVQERKERKVFSRGIWAPAATVSRVRVKLASERSTECRQLLAPVAVSRRAGIGAVNRPGRRERGRG